MQNNRYHRDCVVSGLVRNMWTLYGQQCLTISKTIETRILYTITNIIYSSSRTTSVRLLGTAQVIFVGLTNFITKIDHKGNLQKGPAVEVFESIYTPFYGCYT